MAANEQRFQRYRNDPALVRGTVLSNVKHSDDGVKRWYLHDLSNGSSFHYAPYNGGEPPYFTIFSSDGRMLHAEVEYLTSRSNGFERLYVITKPHVREPQSKPEPYTLTDDEVSRVASLFATLINSIYHDGHATYVVYDHDAGPWTPDR
jgi:hypothetical protein